MVEFKEMETATVVREVLLWPASTEREGGTPGDITSQPPSSPHEVVLPPDPHDGRDRPPLLQPVAVRGARVKDLAPLRRLPTIHRLNQQDTHLVPFSPLRSGLRSLVPGRHGQRPFFVACAGDRLIGFVQFELERPDQRWVLLALGADGVLDVEVATEALLEHAVATAGSRGVKRLYARVPEGSPIGAPLRRVGWTPYATETVFGLPRPVVPGRSVTGSALRRQEQSDTWAIHQLYNAVVPRQVQYAEAFTSHRWDAGRGRGGRNPMVVGWLVEEEHQILGHVRASSRGGTHVLELVYLPDRRDVLEILVDGALHHLSPSTKRVFCAIRGYQAEAASVLTDRGFSPVLEQELHIKYTTANVRLPSWEAVPFRVDVRDKLPKRVPTFLHGQPRDESAT